MSFLKRKIAADIPKTEPVLNGSEENVPVKLNNSFFLEYGLCQTLGDHTVQEDSTGIVLPSKDNPMAVFAVCDGMGGLSDGDKVSGTAVVGFLRRCDKISEKDIIGGERLADITEEINDEIKSDFPNGGSTLAAALIYGNRLYWVGVGDTKLYLYRNNALYSVNEEHNGENKAIRRKLRNLSPETYRGSLSSYLGMEQLYEVETSKIGFQLQNGDKLLICSDGIYGIVSEEFLIDALNLPPYLSAKKMVSLADGVSIVGRDNGTALVISIIQNEKGKTK